VGSDAMIYTPSFIKIGSGIQKFMGGIHRYIDTQTINDIINLLLRFQNKESNEYIPSIFMVEE
jgi:hypothetical protein